MHRSALADQEQRINLLITNQNTKNDEVVGEINAHRAEILAQQALLKVQHGKATRALDETRDLDSRLSMVAITKNGSSILYVVSPIVTCFSCMASSNAL